MRTIRVLAVAALAAFGLTALAVAQSTTTFISSPTGVFTEGP